MPQGSQIRAPQLWSLCPEPGAMRTEAQELWSRSLLSTTRGVTARSRLTAAREKPSKSSRDLASQICINRQILKKE